MPSWNFSSKSSSKKKQETATPPPSSPEKRSPSKKEKEKDKEKNRRSGTPVGQGSFTRKDSAPSPHPLNFYTPPDERKRFSAPRFPIMSDPVPDVDRDAASSPPPSSPPGSFPRANGTSSPVGAESAQAPAPPPHRVPMNNSQPSTPQIRAEEAEAFKAAGNKFFKAQDYPKAIQEYSRGLWWTVSACESQF